MDRIPPLTRKDLVLALDIIKSDFEKELVKFKLIVKNPTKKQCNVMKAHMISHLYGELINWDCRCEDIENLRFLPVVVSKGNRAMMRSLKKQLKKQIIKC